MIEQKWRLQCLDAFQDYHARRAQQLICPRLGLATSTFAIELSDDERLISVSSNPVDYKTLCSYNPPLQEIQHVDKVRTILRSDMHELDGIDRNVDVV